MVLDAIVQHKRDMLAQRWPTRRQECPAGLELSKRSLATALCKPHTGFILECKKASPSRGLIRKDFDIVKIARAYAPFADAISVLTDERYFQGHISYLRQVSDAVEVPVLCKDFIVEPFQIVQARQAGADAVLLMMSVLDDREFRQCFEMAERLAMDALVEVRDEPELNRALSMGAHIIGINNRNLDTLRVDMNTTDRLLPKIPRDKLIVCESGISRHSQVRRYRNTVDGFLVGSALMSASHITRACGELIYGNVKVCGLTRPEDAQRAAHRGVRYGGLIFAEQSKRRVRIDAARAISDGVPLDWVGVFVDAPIKDVAKIARVLGVHAVQLHGREDAAYVAQLRTVLDDNTEIWKGISVVDRLPDLRPWKDCRLLFDGRCPGSGIPFDWSLLRDVPMDSAILAGGLNADNLDVAQRLAPFAVDLNSGIETAPGKKDPTRLDEALTVLRGRYRPMCHRNEMQ